MTMHYEGSITVGTSPREAMALFMDVPRMAALIPGATIERREDDGAYRGTMVVAFGPKRVTFHGKVTVDFNLDSNSGTMLGRGTGNVRGANLESKMSFDVAEAAASTADSPASVVNIRAEILLGGVLAEFARTGGPVVAAALLKEFSDRLEVELAAVERPERAATGVVRSAARSTPVLRGDRMVWTMLMQYARVRLQAFQRKLSSFLR